jgi:hypothetical protein
MDRIFYIIFNNRMLIIKNSINQDSDIKNQSITIKIRFNNILFIIY